MSNLWQVVDASRQTDRIVKAIEGLAKEVRAQREATERVEALLAKDAESRKVVVK